MKKRIWICFLTVAVLFSFLPWKGLLPSKALMVNERKEGDVMRILLLGRDRTAKLCDTMMILSVDHDTNRAAILQIPRDTYAEYTTRDYKKLNGAAKVLGEEKLKGFLSEALGVPIHYYVTVDLDLFRAAVDAIGGVDLVIPNDMHYDDPAQDLSIHFNKGEAHLDGKAAEEFVRYRSGYANADLGRMDAQKLFLRAFLHKCRSISPFGIARLLLPLILHTQTDMTISYAMHILRLFIALDTDTLPIQTLPGAPAQGNSGAWYYVVCRDACKEALPEIFLEDINLFDPNGVFDREEHPEFHRIYHAPRDHIVN